MRQALEIKCWKCREVFTMGAEVSRKPGPLVEVAIPCPFCQTTNQATVRADQVKFTVLYRDGQSAEAVELDQPGAFKDQVFEGTPPAAP
jgi:phage FluMu protein Com